MFEDLFPSCPLSLPCVTHSEFRKVLTKWALCPKGGDIPVLMLHRASTDLKRPEALGGFIPASSWSEAFCIKKLKKKHFTTSSTLYGSYLIRRPRLLILPSSKCNFHFMVQDDCCCPCHQVSILVSGEKVKGQSLISSSPFFEDTSQELHKPRSFTSHGKVGPFPAKNHMFC